MSYKKKLYRIIFFSLVGFGGGVFFLNLCDLQLGVPRCFDLEELGSFFSFFSIVIFFLSLILLVLHEEVFQSWKKFAKIYFSISTAIILYFAFSGGRGGNFGVGGGMDTEGATMFLSTLFFIISVIIIVRKWLKLRGK
jgi:hypothetical protein